MDAAKLEKLYVAHREEALSLAVRKWRYTRDHAEDALQRATLYLLESWKGDIGRSGFIQNVRQQCVNLMGRNEGRSMSRGAPRRLVLVGGHQELEVAEGIHREREYGKRAFSGKRHEGSSQLGI